MRTVIVPFFISHQGCPHTCVFCDQRTISGSGGKLPDAVEIISKIEQWRGTAGNRQIEVAFFGGTFTALSEDIQAGLLLPLQKLLKDGILNSIRISTRPDYIDAARVEWLTKHGVRTIELGVQSFDDSVLSASGRGHLSSDSILAIKCVKNGGAAVGVQLMPGLPGDTPLTSLASMEQAIDCEADFLRIYPTVVLKGTELARRYNTGAFMPLNIKRGVTLCKLLLQRAMKAGIPVIRLGLQADFGLNEDSVIGGCWHPSLGQIVRSGMYADLINQVVSPNKSVKINNKIFISLFLFRIFSDLVGLNKKNQQSHAECGVIINILSDSILAKEEIRMTDEGIGIGRVYSIINDLNYSIYEV